MVPAYDDEILWEGHSSMIKEISKQLSNKPDVIFCSVGGGGLLGGIIVGCKHVGWDDGAPLKQMRMDRVINECHTLLSSDYCP